MCSPRPSDSSSEKVRKKFGVRLWYFIKIVEYVLIAVCVLFLVLNEYLSVIHDDFTPAYVNKTPKENSDKPNMSVIYTAHTRPHFKDHDLIHTTGNYDHHHPDTKLSYLLILYPSCTTIVILLTMELLAQAFKDPLNKLSNIILIILSTFLSITVFATSLVCAIDTVHISVILVTILSAVLIVVTVIDFILLVLS